MTQKYIIGDLVKVWRDLEIKYQVAEVAGCNPYISEYILTNWFIEDTIGVISVTEDRIMPIPLTPEILEKNGWKQDGIWYCLPTKRAYLYITQDAEQPDEFLICVGEGKHNLTSVSFVHQLQHLFFSLNINHEMEV